MPVDSLADATVEAKESATAAPTAPSKQEEVNSFGVHALHDTTPALPCALLQMNALALAGGCAHV